MLSSVQTLEGTNRLGIGLNPGSGDSEMAETSFPPEFVEKLNRRRSEPGVMAVYKSINADVPLLELL
jgi:hypothetical protein